MMTIRHAAVADSSAAFAAQIDEHRSYLLRTARMKLRCADTAGLPRAVVNEGVAVAYERRRLCEQVLDELEAFSPKAAQIFVLREIEGEDTGAICRRLKLSSANGYVLLHRARQFLHQRFESFSAAAA